MKFATIMREAGINARLFPECGEIDVVLYDDYDKINNKEDISFAKKLFEDNPESYNRFFDLVDKLNCNPDYLSINIQITPERVIVFYKTAQAKYFRRTSSDPVDDEE